MTRYPRDLVAEARRVVLGTEHPVDVEAPVGSLIGPDEVLPPVGSLDAKPGLGMVQRVRARRAEIPQAPVMPGRPGVLDLLADAGH